MVLCLSRESTQRSFSRMINFVVAGLNSLSRVRLILLFFERKERRERKRREVEKRQQIERCLK